MTEAAAPTLECDIVMKGGITSGVVYPGALDAIARDYRLRSIGGTSAGAIAAAAAAAMEFGRQTGRTPDALARLAAIPTVLGAPAGDGRFLQKLFAADRSTSELFDLAMGVRAGGWGRVLWRFVRVPLIPAAGFALAIVLLLATAGHPAWRLGTGAALLLGLCQTLVLVVPFALLGEVRPFVRRSAAAVVGNRYGMCSGMATSPTRPGEPPASALTPWLHATFQSLAGLPSDEPLTFGDLWSAAHRTPANRRDEAIAALARAQGPTRRLRHGPDIAGCPRSIELALVTTDVSRGLSLQLPFLARSDRLFVRRSDLAHLFPGEVVDWIAAHPSHDNSDLAGVDLGGVPEDDLLRLPRPQDLPVLLAVRASLAFPGVFSAVRLYLVRRRVATAGGGEALVELLLADGGITSNFPLHLFDAPVPTRPTFCLNLVYAGESLEEEGGEPGDDSGAVAGLAPALGAPGAEVYMPRTNGGRIEVYKPLDRGSPIADLVGFFAHVVSAARLWADNQLMNVPGYRDRIAHIRMGADEGGFNLAMGPETLASLDARGRVAGAALAGRFRPGATRDPLDPGQPLRLNWANHRYVRLRSFLAGVEVMASRFATGWARDRAANAADPSGSPSLDHLLATLGTRRAPAPYVGYARFRRGQRTLLRALVRDLVSIGTAVQTTAADRTGADLVDGESTAPRPKPLLRLRPAADQDPRAEQPWRA